MGVRGPKRNEPVEDEHGLYAIRTCPAHGIVGSGHPKAMPVLLTTAEERRTWLEASAEIALGLQRLPPNNVMREIARGRRSDGA